MTPGFTEQYEPSAEDFKRLWAQGLFVFDASVLLKLYKYGETTRDDFFKVVTALRERVWVPHQAAMEYQRNRPTVIAEHLKGFRHVRKAISTGPVEAALSPYGDPARSPFQTDDFLKSLKKVVEEFEKYLDEVEAKQIRVDTDDPVRTKLDELLKGKVGAPYSQEQLDAIYLTGAARYGRLTPPGYADPKKKGVGEYDYANRVYKREFGDLILWRQVLDWTASQGLKEVVLVTDDATEDWWHIVEDEGRKTLGPRPELRAEIREVSGVELFYLYNSIRFLKFGGDSFSLTIQSASVSQVETIQEVDAMRDASITFKSGSWWNSDRGAVGFRALVDGRVVPCLISEESLEDYFGAELGPRSQSAGTVMQAAFEKNRRTIELIAKDAIRNGRIDATGTVLISTRDVEAGLAKKKVEEVKRYAVVLATQAWELAIKLGREAPLPIARATDSIKIILKEGSDAHELLADIRSEIDPVLWERTKVDDGRTGEDIFERLADVIEDLIRLERQLGDEAA